MPDYGDVKKAVSDWSEEHAGQTYSLSGDLSYDDYKARDIAWPEEDIAPHTSMVDAGQIGPESMYGYGEVSGLTRWFMTKFAGGVQNFGNMLPSGNGWKMIGSALTTILPMLDMLPAAVEFIPGTISAFAKGNVKVTDFFEDPYAAAEKTWNMSQMFWETMGTGTSTQYSDRALMAYIAANPGTSREDAYHTLTGQNMADQGTKPPPLKRKWDQKTQSLVELNGPTFDEVGKFISDQFDAGLPILEVREALVDEYGAFAMEGEVLNGIMYMLTDMNIPTISRIPGAARRAAQAAAGSVDAVEVARRGAALSRAADVLDYVDTRVVAAATDRAAALVKHADDFTPNELRIINNAVSKGEPIPFSEIKTLEEFAHLDDVRHVVAQTRDLAIVTAERAAGEFADAQGLPTLTAGQQRVLNWIGQPDPVIESVMSDSVKWKVLNTPRYLIRKIQTPFRLIAKSNAALMIQTVQDAAKIGLGDFASVDAIASFFRSANEGIASLGELGPVSATLVGKTLRESLTGFSRHVDDLMEIWNGTIGTRQDLTNIGVVLGKRHVADVVGDLVGKNGAQRVYQALQDAVKLPEALPSAARQELLLAMREGRLTVETLQELADLYKNWDVPFDIDTFKAAVMVRLGEHSAAMYAAKFGITDQGWITKAADMVKAAEALGFLRLSPTYPIRNFMNNEITMISRGVWSGMTAKKIVRFWDRAGFNPARLEEGIGPANEIARAAEQSVQGGYQAGMSKLDEMVKGKGNWMDKVNDFIRQDFPGPLKRLDTAKFSANLERGASMRAYTTGYIRAWKGTWIQGVGYNSVTDFAEGVAYKGKRLDDNMIRALHGAISDAVGPSEVRAAFRDFNGYSFSTVMDDVAKRLGISRSQIDEVLPEEFLLGLEQDITAAMRAGDKAQVMQVLEGAHPRISNYMDDFAARSAMQEAERIADAVEAGDVMQFYRLYGQNNAAFQDAHIGHLAQQNDRIAAIKALPVEQQGKAWDRWMADSDTYFKGHYTRYEQRLQGLIDAANKGGVPVPDEAITPFRNMNRANEEFFLVRKRSLSAYRNSDRTSADWLRHTGRMDTEYQKLQRVMDLEAVKLDEILYRVVDANNPSLSVNVRAARATVNQLRKNQMQKVRQVFRELEEMDGVAKSQRLNEFTNERLAMSNQVALAERELQNVLYKGEAYGAGLSDPEVMAIYNRNLGGGLYAQSFDDAVQELVEAGADPVQAQRMVSRSKAVEGRTLGGRMDKYQADPRRGGQPASWWKPEMAEANKALVDAENAGRNVAEMVPGAAEKIQDVEMRMTWLDKVAVETGPRSDIGKAALKQLSFEWQSTPTNVFANPATTPLRNQPYALISAEKSGLSATDNMVRMERLAIDAQNMGYSPIKARGFYAGEEGSLLIPGIRQQDAIELGIRNGQESVVVSNQGLVYTGRISGNDVPVGQMDFGAIEFGDDFDDFYTVVRVGGRDVKFRIPFDETAPTKQWVVPLDGENDTVKLYRMQHNNQDVIDPHNSLSYNGAARTTPPVAGYGKPGSPKLARLYYYIDGTPAETRLASLPHKLEVNVPAHKIYDLAADPDGFLKVVRNTQDLEHALKEAGYYGYRYTEGPGPNSVAIWESLERVGVEPRFADEAATLMKQEGAAMPSDAYMPTFQDPLLKASPSYGNTVAPGNVSVSGAHFRKQILDLELPGLHKDNVDAFIQITEARARTWSIQSGQSVDDWYDRNLGGFYRGTQDIADHHDMVFSQRMWTTDEFKDVMTEVGLVSPETMFNVLASEELPTHLRDVMDFMTRKRTQITDPNGPGFIGTDVARAYILSTSSIRAKAVTLSHLMDGAPDTLKRMFEGARLDDFSYVNRAGVRMVRPEDFTAAWLRTNEGRRLLAGAAVGRADVDSMSDLMFIRDMFGAKNNLGNWLQGKKGLRTIPDLTDELNGLRLLDEAAGEMVVDFGDMGKVLQKLDGIGKTKDPFMRHFFGFGEMGVMDSRAINAWMRGDITPFEKINPVRTQLSDLFRGKAPEQSKEFLGTTFGPAEKGTSPYMSRRPIFDHIENSVNDSIRQMQQMGLGPDIPDEMYNYIIHHWIWDKVGEASGEGINRSNQLYVGFAQRDPNKFIRGAIDLRDTKAIVHAFGAADESTLIHEIAHLFRREIAQDQILAKQLGILEEFYGVKQGAKWTTKQEEKFARAFEVYLREGVAPVSSLDDVFKRFENWLQNIYQSIRGNALDVPINDDIRGIFDDLLDYENARPANGYTQAPGLSPSKVDELLPQQAPISEGQQNLWWTQGGNMYEEMVGATSKHMDTAPLKFDNLDVDQTRLLRGYEDDVLRKVPLAQTNANRWGMTLRDGALLNYHRRTKFDHYAGHVFPFGFWAWNSMWNWATWNSGGLPIMANYFRLNRMTNRVGRKDMPQRFQGSFQIKSALMPKWMGGSIYVNPLRTALPFEGWMDPIKNQVQEEENVHKAMQTWLDREVRAGNITGDEFQTAMLTRSGEVWDRGMADVKDRLDPSHPIDNLSYLMAPHAPLMWTWHALRGNKEKIGPFLPITRSVKGITSMMGVNNGLGFNPESGLRKAVGLPEGDQYDQYRIERMLSNMLSAGEISVAEFHVALEDKETDDNYVIAQQRAAQEYAVGAIGSALGIPTKPFPEGEERGLALRKDLDLAYASKDPNAVKNFFDEYPEVEGRLALWDDPETRAPVFLAQQLWDKWHGLTSGEKRTLSEALGEDFQRDFLNKDTRVDNEELDLNNLAVWSRTLGLLVPSTIEGKAKPFEFAPDEVRNQINAYDAAKKAKFPDIFVVQEEFFAIDEDDKRARRAFKAENPQLQKYWDWRRNFMLSNPDIIPYLVEDPTSLEPRDPEEEAVLEEGQQTQPNLTWREWQPVLSLALWRLAGDEFRSGLQLGPAEMEELDRIADQMQIPVEVLMRKLKQSYEDTLQEGE